MPDTPFVGPTYSLRSKPASVQRTVNMEPVPLEPGNERTGWVFKDVPGLVPVTTSLAPSIYVDCELLLHFDQTVPGGWIDYSIRHRAIAQVLNTGTISYSASGEYAGAMRLAQVHPAAGSTFPNEAAYLTASGNINFGANEFFMSAWVNLDGTLPDASATPQRPSMTILSALNAFDNIHNSPWFFALTASPASANVFPQASLYGGGGVTGYTVNSGGTPLSPGWHHIAFSRKNGVATNDVLYTFVDGVQAAATSMPLGFVVDNGTLGYTRVGAQDNSPTVGAPAVIQSFHGLMDEVYVSIGVGINVTFTPPPGPFVSTKTLRQMLGLDP